MPKWLDRVSDWVRSADIPEEPGRYGRVWWFGAVTIYGRIFRRGRSVFIDADRSTCPSRGVIDVTENYGIDWLREPFHAWYDPPPHKLWSTA